MSIEHKKVHLFEIYLSVYKYYQDDSIFALDSNNSPVDRY